MAFGQVHSKKRPLPPKARQRKLARLLFLTPPIESLSVSIICRDSAKTIGKLLESIIVPSVSTEFPGAAFDEIVVLDTGSVDDTLEIVEGFRKSQEAMGGLLLVERTEWPKHFARARQRSFELASCTWRGWLDSDDVLPRAGRLKRDILQKFSNRDAILLPYHYAIAEDGAVLVKINRERFVRWSLGWKWVGRIHEYLTRQEPYGTRYSSYIILDMPVIHQTKPTELQAHLERNLSVADLDSAGEAESPAERQRILLEHAMLLRGADARKAEDLVRSGLSQDFGDSITTLQLLTLLVELLVNRGEIGEAKSEALKMLDMNLNARAGYMALGQVSAHQGNLQAAARWFALGHRIPRDEREHWQEKNDQQVLLALQAFSTVGDKESFALALAEHPDLRSHPGVHRTEQQFRTVGMAATFNELVQYVADHDEFERAATIARNVPYSLARSISVALTRRKITSYVDHHAELAVDPGWARITVAQVEAIKAGQAPNARAEWITRIIRERGYKRILSVGSCDGFVEGYIATQLLDVTVTCYDRNADALRHAQDMWRAVPNLKFQTTLTPRVLNDQDALICFEVIEHIRPVLAREFWEDLRRNGLPVFITTPSEQPDGGKPPSEPTIGEAGHVRIFRLAELHREYAPIKVSRIPEALCDLWGIETTFNRIVAYDPAEPLSAVFVCPGYLTWGPKTAETRGLTGSEECVLYLSKALAETGGRPTVCVSSLDGPECIEDGVMWTDLGFLAEADLGPPSHLVIWRTPDAINWPVIGTASWRSKTLWLHDVDYGTVADETWAKYDRIVCATEYHKNVIAKRYPAAAERLIVIRHGLPEMPNFEHKVPGKCIYASSPDRGLERLLAWWPAVKERCPNAELHVFYGTANMRALAAYHPYLIRDADRIEAKLLELEPLGVVNHGLVSHEVLHKHMSEATALLFPTTFDEISCLTVQKAQAAGCHVVWSPGGCLSEVVRNCPPFWTDLKNLDSEEAKKEFVRHVEEALKSSGNATFDGYEEWGSVAGRWVRELSENGWV